MIGSLYDWEYPELNNQEIIDFLVVDFSFKTIFDKISKYSGEYVFKDRVYIIGNIYEIARSVLGQFEYVSAEDLTFILGYGKMKFPEAIYRKWLKNRMIFKKFGYHFLDFFYWEERLGIWLSKSRTEQLGLNKLVVSPYNSRMFLDSLLSVERKYRGEHFNHLQNQILAVLCNNNRKVLNLPINPIFRKKICIVLYKLNLYTCFRYIGLKSRLF